MNNLFEIITSCNKNINFAMQQNNVPIIDNLRIKNNSKSVFSNISIEIKTDPEFTFEWKKTISTILQGQIIEIDVSDLSLSPSKLYELTESISSKIIINLNIGSEIVSEVISITLLAYDEWGGYNNRPEIAAAFVTPNHPMISRIVKNASYILKKWTGSDAFTGYQSQNPNNVIKQLAALYESIKNEEITYNAPPASYEEVGQRVRLCDTISQCRMATCLDYALLYASCIESVGLNPLIIFKKGHAFCGCMLEDEYFGETIQDDISILTKKTAEGVNEICLMEGFMDNFESSNKTGINHLKDAEDFVLFIDIKRCRLSGIKPMPIRVRNENGQFLEYTQAIEKVNDIQSINAPKELEIVDINTINTVITRQNIWERKLLDLSLRNSLLNFRLTKGSLQILNNSLNILEDRLASGEEFAILSKATDFNNSILEDGFYDIKTDDVIEDNISKDFANNKIRTFYDEIEVEKRLKALYRSAKVSIEENGSNTLYLALGFLKWFESTKSEKARYAPIVLWPIEIVRKSAKVGYVIRVRDEEPQINVTLLELLKSDYELDILGLDPLPQDENGIDLTKVFKIIRQSIMNKPKWDVVEFSFIGVFSFNQFIMWNDIRNRSEDLKKNKIVSSLIDGQLNFENDENFPLPEDLDNIDISELAVPLSADSSQLAAVSAASKGNSFVLHGPPGTGKSQTITNMIANALYQGKSVLFIAEKMAALSVVQKRLESIGIGPFCLELHSNKAKKKDVLEHFERILEYAKVSSGEEFTKEAEKLYKLRKELNETMQLLHAKQQYGFSLYEAITRAEQYESYKNVIEFNDDYINSFTSEKFEQCVQICSKASAASTACKGVTNNALQGLNGSEYSLEIKESLLSVINGYNDNLKCIYDNCKQLFEIYNVDIEDSYENIILFAEFIEILTESGKRACEMASIKDIYALEAPLREICVDGKRFISINDEILSVFNDRIFNMDPENMMFLYNQAQNTWFLPKIIKINKIVKQFTGYISQSNKFDKNQIHIYIEKLIEHKKIEEKIKSFDTPEVLNGVNTNWDETLSNYEQAVQICEYVKKISQISTQPDFTRAKLTEVILSNYKEFFENNKNTIDNINSYLNSIKSFEQKLISLEKVEIHNIFDNKKISEIQSIFMGWISNIDYLREWSNYIEVKNEMNNLEIDNLCNALEHNEISEGDILPTFYKNISFACANNIISNNSNLTKFSGKIFENKIEDFKKDNEKYENLTKLELLARLSARIPQSGIKCADSSEIGILNKAIKSRGRMMSIRKLFDSIPILIRRLCPCMLMSPISVAQYIDPSFPEFDLVIFDEASQLPTCEAVGAIARGKNLIVVGDPKQLPPTSFFTSNRVDEDNYDKEDLESILDDCLALDMPSEHLLWHYRSRHESLIAFSNRQFYDNKLFTFTSPNDLVSEVKHIPVEGFYDRGKTKQNKAEAEAIVNEIVSRLNDPELQNQSIGVVTFSVVQQNLIDDLLMEEFAKNPKLEEINSNSPEPIFIKNLENVQGDERDVIMFSIGYGPDKDGKVALNFGPLNRDGGWRRLNVAVTRARRQMLVYSVLRPEQLDLTRTASDGLKGLKAFLEFAMYGKSMLPIKNVEVNKNSFMSSTNEGIETSIAKELRKLGYKVDTSIGCSEYKLDLGIVNPHNEKEYILGVLCDGINYKKAATAKDRNILQENVLKSLGWNIERVWSLDWWDSKNKVLEKLTSRIDELINNYGNTFNQNKVEIISTEQHNKEILQNLTLKGQQRAKKEDNCKEYFTRDYVLFELDDYPDLVPLNEDYYSNDNNMIIKKQIEQILVCEAPISRNVLLKRILDNFNISRKSIKFENRIDELLVSMNITITKEDDECLFYWNKEQNPDKYTNFRTIEKSDFKRCAEDICDIEVANVINNITKNQMSLTKDDLERETLKALGYTRTTPAISEMFNRGLKKAVELQYVVINDNKVIGKEFYYG